MQLHLRIVITSLLKKKYRKNILHTCTLYGLNRACSFGGSTRETNLLGHMAIPYFASVPWLWHKLNQLTVSAPALPSGTRLQPNNLVNP